MNWQKLRISWTELAMKTGKEEVLAKNNEIGFSHYETMTLNITLKILSNSENPQCIFSVLEQQEQKKNQCGYHCSFLCKSFSL